MRSARLSLRSRAVEHTLFSVAALPRALVRLPFVQADPIRSPARAQDLILRQRVAGYRVGDLERAYPDLDLEEGYLYAYGFLPRAIWQMRHPPNTSRLPAIEKKVWERVRELGVAHPEALRAELGRSSRVNAWGGQSTRVKLALEALHQRGLLRVARRQNGIRLYAPCAPLAEELSPAEVFERVALTVCQTLAPASERSLRSIMTRLCRRIPGITSPAKELAALVARGVLVRETLDEVGYVWPAEPRGAAAIGAALEPGLASARRVRFLAPFDPLVWDRQRFEQLWGWSYRFEAYTPAAKRLRGYYAMPLCFGEDVIGWANVAAGKSPRRELDVELGFVRSRPRGAEFRSALDAEVERLRVFLVPPAGVPAEDVDTEEDPRGGRRHAGQRPRA
jgi:uncharacterized protein